MVMTGGPSTKIDLRPNPDLESHPFKSQAIFHEKMLLERKHITDFEQVLKEIDFINSLPFAVFLIRKCPLLGYIPCAPTHSYTHTGETEEFLR